MSYLRLKMGDDICDTVNELVPNYNRGAAAPSTITRYEAASCFARAALGAVALRENKKRRLSDMSILISSAHGMPRQGKLRKNNETRHPYWYGHAMLILHDKKPALVFECGDTLFCYEADTAGWEPEYRFSPPLLAVDKDKLALHPSKHADQNIPPDIWRKESYMTVHTVEESVSFYQETHPILRRYSPWQFDDYVIAFHALQRAAAV